MNKNSTIIGHGLALFTALVWGCTLISTKILLRDFQPVEILFSRFVIALFALWLIGIKDTKENPVPAKKQNAIFMLAGLFGITLYYLFENTALIYTLASNVGVINCTAPLFVAILVFVFLKNKEKMGLNFIAGFIISITGISLIAFNGTAIHLNPLGDMLAICAALSWAIYSILIKKLYAYGFSTLFITKKTFFWGTLFMIPFLFLFDYHLGFERFLSPVNLLNILFLGFLASALCFATWSKAIKILGAIKSGAYIYLIPVVTLIMAVTVLKEPVSGLLILGAGLVLTGLFVSEYTKKGENK